MNPSYYDEINIKYYFKSEREYKNPFSLVWNMKKLKRNNIFIFNLHICILFYLFYPDHGIWLNPWLVLLKWNIFFFSLVGGHSLVMSNIKHELWGREEEKMQPLLHHWVNWKGILSYMTLQTYLRIRKESMNSNDIICERPCFCDILSEVMNRCLWWILFFCHFYGSKNNT